MQGGPGVCNAKKDKGRGGNSGRMETPTCLRLKENVAGSLLQTTPQVKRVTTPIKLNLIEGGGERGVVLTPTGASLYSGGALLTCFAAEARGSTFYRPSKKKRGEAKQCALFPEQRKNTAVGIRETSQKMVSELIAVGKRSLGGLGQWGEKLGIVAVPVSINQITASGLGLTSLSCGRGRKRTGAKGEKGAEAPFGAQVQRGKGAGPAGWISFVRCVQAAGANAYFWTLSHPLRISLPYKELVS